MHSAAPRQERHCALTNHFTHMQYCNATISICTPVQCLSIIWMYLLLLVQRLYIHCLKPFKYFYFKSTRTIWNQGETHDRVTTHCCYFEIDLRICLIIKPNVNQMQSSSIANQQLELWEAVRLSPSCGVRGQRGLHANFSRCFGSFDILFIM